MDILVIGYGQTGFEIVKNLSKLNYINKIYIHDPKTKNKLINKNTIFVNNLSKLQNLEYVLITLSTINSPKRKQLYLKYNNTYDVRRAELKSNLIVIKKYLLFLKNLDKTTKIIVVTNPIDEITNYLQKKLPNKQIIGFGMQLDAKRFSKELNKTIDCIGLHGKAIPLANLKSEKEYENLQSNIDIKLLKYIRKIGIPSKIAGSEFKVFFDKLNSKKENKILMGYKNKDICISLPYIVKNGNIIKPAKIKLNKIEKKLFKKEINELKTNLRNLR